MNIIDDGCEVNVPIADDISPETERERWGISSGKEASERVLWVVVVDIAENVRLLGNTELFSIIPRGATSMHPVPCIEGVVVVIYVSDSFKSPASVIGIIIKWASLSGADKFIEGIGYPKRLSKDRSPRPRHYEKVFLRAMVGGWVSQSPSIDCLPSMRHGLVETFEVFVAFFSAL